MLIDSGDAFTRGPLWNAYRGIPDIESMNAVGYELAAIGNNEFKALDGVDQSDAAGSQAALLLDIRRSRFPWICANATDAQGSFLEGVQPYVVRNFDGVLVGFLGLTAPRSASYPQTKGWTISDPIAAAKRWIPEARAHCDILIAVTHIGVDGDKQLAAQTTGIDAIVGGDSHTYLYKAIEIANTDGAMVPIVQDGEFGVDLGRFDVNLTRSTGGAWRLSSYTEALLPVDASLAEARDVDAVIEPYRKPYDDVIGKVAPAKSPAERMKQTTQIVVDALHAQTDEDYAVNPVGAGFFNVFHNGDITRYDVYAVMPFHNVDVVATMPGSELLALLKPGGIAVSGDITKIDSTKTYSVAMVDFVAHDAFHVPGAELGLGHYIANRDIRDVVIDYLYRAMNVGKGPAW